MSVAPLISAYDSQDISFAAAFLIIRQAIADHAFPGASLAVTHTGKLVALKSFGSFVYKEDLVGEPSLATFLQGRNSDVRPETVFDVASLTKPIATTTMVMMLYERGLLELDAPVAGIVPEILSTPIDPRRREITFGMLLAHSSGLPAYEKLFLKARTRDALLNAAFNTPLTTDPGTRSAYSDLGFIILGVALERIAGEPLDRFCQREVFGPLAMTRTTFTPPAELRSQIPPTADESARDSALGESQSTRSTFRNRVIQGEVQDENAYVLRGVAGHSGLFASAEDIAKFAHTLLQCGVDTTLRAASTTGLLSSTRSTVLSPIILPILRRETIALFTRRESTPSGSSRTLGWDTPSAPSQSGKYFGPNSYGHLGYTGTSLWIDPDRDLSVTLLTNRTWPDCSSQAIKQVRPKVHDAIVEALL